jgi:hypothetical protein
MVGIFPKLGEGEGLGFMFCSLMEAENGLLYVEWFQQRCSTASYCQHKLLALSICTLHDVVEITNGQPRQNSNQHFVFWRGTECHRQLAEFLLYKYKIRVVFLLQRTLLANLLVKCTLIKKYSLAD